MSYAAPESSEASQGLYDSSYDGSRVNGELQGGLGRLVDGEFGADNFRLDIGYGKGNGWISWKNDSVPNGYVELTFEFDQIPTQPPQPSDARSQEFQIRHLPITACRQLLYTKHVEVFINNRRTGLRGSLLTQLYIKVQKFTFKARQHKS
ncbi:hypothetical protein Zmor_005805 [Zophobas morio]|uniref:Discoidin domain-containing protein n=1 Tax=Zophobas morio TaxID=2755281 RepID=A0AA38IQM1_9CUCU|nr:hypothetical protein Zmor_005805 [Zophobas morio]